MTSMEDMTNKAGVPGGVDEAPAADAARSLIDALPTAIPAAGIGLPCAGAVVDRAEERTKDAPHVRVTGRVLSLDPEAEPITFQMLLPAEGWNGRLLHIGGGGFNGTVPFMGHVGIGAEMWHGVPVPVARGYAVIGSDSGHAMRRSDAENWAESMGADFALNDEMLANFAHEHIKKVHDVGVALLRAAYGREPEHSYYAGTSNGGRESLMAIQRYPRDFDGILCGYPAIRWIPMALFGLACADVEEAVGEEGFIGPEAWRRFFGADGSRQDRGALNEVQLRLLDACEADLDVSFLEDEALPSYPGYAVGEGEPLRDDDNLFVLNGLSSAPGARDGSFAQFGDSVVSRMVLRDATYDTRNLDPLAHVTELRRASELLDASSLDWDAFVACGGKAIMYHGTYDQLISVRSTTCYHDALRGRYGDALDGFLRCYVVPGEGHSIGLFDMGADLLGALDAWVTGGKAPEALELVDTRPDRDGATQVVAPR